MVTRNKEGQYIMIKGSIQEEDRTIINIYVPNIRAPKYITTNRSEGRTDPAIRKWIGYPERKSIRTC